MLKFLEQDTICALATPQGHGGVAMIRVSGPEAAKIVLKLCPKFTKKWQSHHLYYTNIYDLSASNIIDEVVLSFYKENKSYTGEESVEISCHGSPIIASQILQELNQAGCRMAERGEFTYRAFMNQRIDLSQAESVLSLIESRSKQASQLSLRQLKGELSNECQKMEEKLTYVLANLEASIDFSTEDIEVMDYEGSKNNLLDIKKTIDQILATYKKGRILQEGLHIAIIGKPNTGKSSLLNALVQENKALVSDVPGTTRDLVEAEISVEGCLVRFLDTAGIHLSEDKVEKMGIDKTYEAIKKADFVFYVIGPEEEQLNPDILASLKNKPHEIWQSKADIKKTPLLTPKSFHSLTKEGFSLLQKKVEELVKENYQEDSAVLFQARHNELFTILKQRVEKALEMMKDDASQEFISLELLEGLNALYEIQGKQFDDDVMDRVFKEFCIGK